MASLSCDLEVAVIRLWGVSQFAMPITPIFKKKKKKTQIAAGKSSASRQDGVSG